jgi:hypothetical protein
LRQQTTLVHVVQNAANLGRENLHRDITTEDNLTPPLRLYSPVE